MRSKRGMCSQIQVYSFFPDQIPGKGNLRKKGLLCLHSRAYDPLWWDRPAGRVWSSWSHRICGQETEKDDCRLSAPFIPLLCTGPQSNVQGGFSLLWLSFLETLSLTHPDVSFHGDAKAPQVGHEDHPSPNMIMIWSYVVVNAHFWSL